MHSPQTPESLAGTEYNQNQVGGTAPVAKRFQPTERLRVLAHGCIVYGFASTMRRPRGLTTHHTFVVKNIARSSQMTTKHEYNNFNQNNVNSFVLHQKSRLVPVVWIYPF